MHYLTKVLSALAIAVAPLAAGVTVAQPAMAQARHWRPGETLPAEVLHAGPNVNYAAQRLRRPPDGYGWFALDGVFALASLANGLIIEVAE